MNLTGMGLNEQTLSSQIVSPRLSSDQQNMEDVGFMTCMTLVILGNFA
jgi:hypothetical protein